MRETSISASGGGSTREARALVAAIAYGFVLIMSLWVCIDAAFRIERFKADALSTERLLDAVAARGGPRIRGVESPDTYGLVLTDAVFNEAKVTVAAAGLEKRLGAFVADRGGLVSSSQVELLEPRGGFRDIDVSMECTMKAEDLGAFLYAIESARPFIFIKKAAISSLAVPTSQSSGMVHVALLVESTSRHEVK